MITPRGKLEEVTYSSYDKLWMMLVAAQKKYLQLIEKQTIHQVAKIRRKKVE